MAHINIEFKAKAKNIADLEKRLLQLLPKYIGEDHQIDTYFAVPKGRLKLREGNIENALIYYERENIGGQKQSNVILYKHQPDKNLKEILLKTHEVIATVNKKRKIYFVDNVKIHFDEVKGLGSFVEVEAIETDEINDISILQEQCLKFATLFEIQKDDYEKLSYSDLLIIKES